MSTTLYLACLPPVPDLAPGLPASPALAALTTRKQTTKLCQKLGVAPLNSFLSYDPVDVADFFKDHAGLPAAPTLPPMQWFDPAPAVATVDALAAEFTARPPIYLKQHPLETIKAELATLKRFLSVAVAHKAKFRLWIAE